MKEQKENVRAFIAVELSKAAKDEIERIINSLKDADTNTKWLSSQTMHLTLKFLGSVSPEKVKDITSSIKTISEDITTFNITFSDIGVFPSERRPKVVWVGIKDDNGEVQALSSKVEGAMEKEGFTREDRPFTPHITLGRIKNGKNIDKLMSITKSINVSPIVSTISRIVLFRSELTSKGAIHTPISKIPFK